MFFFRALYKQHPYYEKVRNEQIEAHIILLCF